MTISRSKYLGPATLLLLLCYSCKYFHAKNTDHPDQLKLIIAKFGDLSYAGFPGSIYYLDTAFERITLPGPGDVYAVYDAKREFYFDKKHDYRHALAYADSMVLTLSPYANEKKYNLRYAEAHLDKGDVLFRQRSYAEAYLEFYEGKTSILPAINSCDEALFMFGFYRRLGDISFNKARFLDAARWGKTGIAVLQGCNHDTTNFYLIQGTLDNIGISYNLAGKPDSAIYYYDQALTLLDQLHPVDTVQKNKIAVARGVIRGNQGTAYKLKGNITLAEAAFKESIAIDSEPGNDLEDAAITHMKLAELYFETGQLAKAGVELRQFNAPVDSGWGPLNRLRLKILKANYANATGDPNKANQWLRRYIDQLKQENAQSANLMSTDFSKEFELLKRQYDVETLTKQNQLKDHYLIVVVAVFLMAVAIIYLILKSNRQEKTNARQFAQHNKQLQVTLAALEKSNLENAQLLSVVAHDLKNPINAIYGISTMMNDEPARTADDKEMLGIIQTSSKNLDRLINDLLAAKISGAGKEQTGEKRVAVDLKDLMQETVSLLRYLAEAKKQRIILLENDSCRLFINRERIWRVINNLVVNAIKFSPERRDIVIGWWFFENEVIISVKDEGIGIPDGLKEKIFQLAGDAKRPGTAGEETFGLGLYISRQIVEEHAGKIWFESEAGQGTTFYIALPVIDPVTN